MPWWYPLIVAARYLKTEPWKLATVPQFWTDAAILALNAEAEARRSVNEPGGAASFFAQGRASRQRARSA